MVDMTTLAKRLQDARKVAKRTQLDLARVAGVSKQAISKLERGETLDPASSTIEPIARYLNTTVRWLVEGKIGAEFHQDDRAAAGGGAKSNTSTPSAPVDIVTLGKAIEITEAETRRAKVSLTPAAKAEVILTIYLELMEGQGIESVARVVTGMLRAIAVPATSRID